MTVHDTHSPDEANASTIARDRKLRDLSALRKSRQDRHPSLRSIVIAVLTLLGFGMVLVAGLAAQNRYHDYSSYLAEQEQDEFRRVLRSSILDIDRASVDVLLPALGLTPHMPAEERLAAISLRLADLAAQIDAKNGAGSDAFLSGAAPVIARIADLGQRARQANLSDKQRVGLSSLLRKAATDLRQLRLELVDLSTLPDMTIGMQLLTSAYALQVHEVAYANTASQLRYLVDKTHADSSASFVVVEDVETLRFSAPAFLDIFQASDHVPQTATMVLLQTLDREFLPAQLAVSQMIETDARDMEQIAALVAASERVTEVTTTLFFQTDVAKAGYLDARISQEWRKFLFFLGLISGVVVLCAMIGALFLRFIALPFSDISKDMLRLAVGDLSRVSPVRTRLADLVAMHDALRVFRANAIRRERLQAERFELHDRIAAANREMRADLEAAANVQQLLRAKSGTVGQFHFETYFRPSLLIGGDTFDFLELHDGRVALFQIDVAGHGAAASLVAVAAHLSMWRGLEAATDAKSVMEEVNRNWWGDLPYFTALLVIFDPGSATARIVQAGHPYPLHVTANGNVASLGQGGVPIGVIGEPDYEEIRVEISHGDRLVVFSDGLYELRNRQGETFGEERLASLVKSLAFMRTKEIVPALIQHLQDWADPEISFDDISLVVMERV